ncbi:MAG TPA: cell envelope integrity protein CreD [Steroidobacteraceae bacterium]|jgi:inner membrane protein
MKFVSSALGKALVVALVALLVMIPVQMLRSLVVERAQMREQAVASVSRGWGGRQSVGGPVLAIPTDASYDNGRVAVRDHYILPESLTVESELHVLDERRKLGVYEVPVYTAKVHLIATFDIAAKLAALGAERVHLDRARLLIPVSDVRGVHEVALRSGALVSSPFEPQQGFPIAALGAALRSDSGIDKGVQTIEVTLEVAGTDALSFLPFARSTTVQLKGNWAHPGFARGLLPAERKITAAQFEAHWKVLDLNRSYGSHWFQDIVSAETLQESAFGVELVQPVDLYQQAERSVKYAGLFIALSLLTLFLWEHLARRPLHPIQYGLMALAMSVFYLLLLALAEHIGFLYAYLAAALALCSLLGIYLAGAFRSSRAGGGSAVAFGATYALLYLLVTSEDYALLAGSLALFAILATVMVLTRRLDWYGSGASPAEDARASR